MSARANAKTNKFFLDIKRRFGEIEAKNRTIQIKFACIPSHISIRRNENVDELAKKVALNQQLYPISIPHIDL